MRIGFDGRLLAYRRGMGGFAASLLAAMSSVDFDGEIRVYVNDVASSGILPDDHRFRAFLSVNVPFPIWEQALLPSLAVRDKLDLLHCPSNTGPVCLPRRTKLLLTIHDVMYLLPKDRLPQSPSMYQRVGRMYRKLMVPVALRRASVVFADSWHSKQDIEHYLPMARHKTEVVYGAAKPAFRRCSDQTLIDVMWKRHGIDGRPIVALGAIDPRKNTGRVIKAYAMLVAMYGAAVPKLVVSGLDAMARERFRNLVAELGLSDQIVLLGFITEAELVMLFSNCTLVMYPSLYEGFGLPVLEAMACGAPVITSRSSSLPEVAGDAAIFVDPENIKAMSEAMAAVVTDALLWSSLSRKGLENAARFSWVRAAEQTIAAYRRVLAV